MPARRRTKLARPATSCAARVLAGAVLAGALVAVPASRASAQQVADSTYVPKVAHPAYASNGPRVLLDEAHYNFHTATGRYRPFVRLLEADGYRVRPNARPFLGDTLRRYQVLVIANAMTADLVESYGRPAFTEAECDTVAEWVRNGGSLLLIADHAPFGTGAESLASRFHVGMSKGYTEDTLHCAEPSNGSILLFSRENHLLRNDVILRGRDTTESVGSVIAYTGQSLASPVGARTLLALADQAFDHPSPTVEQAQKSENPGLAWRTEVAGMATTSARGRVMGLALRYGYGRVVVLGEAAMLTAQVVSMPGAPPRRFGMNAPNDNRQFALNVLHWLSGLLPAE